MKKEKIILLALGLFSLATFISCGNNNSKVSVRTNNSANSVNNVLDSLVKENESRKQSSFNADSADKNLIPVTDEDIALADSILASELEAGQSYESEEDSEEEKSSAEKDYRNNLNAHSKKIDIDLTQLSLSNTMLYSELTNIMWEPEKYEGKRIKLSGAFASYYDNDNEVWYYGCIVRDNMACCSAGLEFTLNDGRVYPDDFPKEGSKITVSGVLTTYEQDGIQFCTLADAEMTVNQ